jgi:acid phosphatase
MSNDGHDSNFTFAASWERNWITPLLNNSYFMDNTLILLTYDESETYTLKNNIFSILLGGAVPPALRGTTDDTFYTHYSAISSVSANWGLPSLGRWDCGANVFSLIANKTGITNKAVATDALYLNASYPGPLGQYAFDPAWPVPETLMNCVAGHGVLDTVVNTWGGMPASYKYTGAYPDVNGTAKGVNGPVSGVKTKSKAKSAAARGSGASHAVTLAVIVAVALGL